MGPSPQELLAASLASCTAITMEMYAKRKGWNLDGPRGRRRLHARRARLPDALQPRPASCRPRLSDEQVERLQVIAAKCPVHRIARRRGHVRRAGRADLSSRATARRRALRAVLLTPGAGGDTRRPRRARTPPSSPRSTSTTTARCTRVFTRRRDDLAAPSGRDLLPRRARRAAATRDLRATALREADEEIGLPPEAVEVVGALRPTPTFVTNYAIYPYVGVIEPGLRVAWSRTPRSADVLELPLGRAARRLRRAAPRAPRHPVPHRRPTRSTATLIWGATARIVGDLLERLGPWLDR